MVKYHELKLKHHRSHIYLIMPEVLINIDAMLENASYAFLLGILINFLTYIPLIPGLQLPLTKAQVT